MRESTKAGRVRGASRDKLIAAALITARVLSFIFVVLASLVLAVFSLGSALVVDYNCTNAPDPDECGQLAWVASIAGIAFMVSIFFYGAIVADDEIPLWAIFLGWLGFAALTFFGSQALI